MIPNAPKHYETHENMSLRFIGVDRVRLSRKIPKPLRGLNICINCTSSAVLDRVSCNNEMVPNAPKHYEMHQNMSLLSNGVDQVHSLRKIQKRLRGMNFCINCSSSAHFAPSFMQYRNGPKCTQTLRNATKVEFRIQWCGSGAFVGKTSDATSWHELLH